MKSKLMCVFVLIGFAMAAQSQNITPQTLSTQAGTLQNNNSVINYSLGQAFSAVLKGGNNILTVGEVQPDPTIVIDSVTDIPLYAGGKISVHFTAKGLFGTGNVFTVQLSDSTGSFANAENIGMDTTTSSGIVTDSIPLNTSGGTGYSVRIISSIPSYVRGHSSVFSIHHIAPPMGLTSETACLDTSYTFNFNGVTAGNGGNQIEWAYNKSFIGSTIVNSPANLHFTVSANSLDTIWARSRDSIDATHIFVSNLISVTERVDTLPNATVSPIDTSLLQGDTLVFQANGGISYYWPDLALDSSTVRTVFSGDSLSYVVNVTGSNGCIKEERGRAYASAYAGFSPVLLLTDPDDSSISIPLTNSDTTIYGCHDYLTLGEVLEPHVDSSFTIVQIFPPDFTPDTTTLSDSSSSIPPLQAAHATGSGITCILHARSSPSSSDTLFWQIPDSLNVGNIKLLTRLYTNCLGDNPNNVSDLTSAPIFSGLLVPGSSTFQDSHTGPSLPNLQLCAIRGSATLHVAANAGELVSHTFSVCALETGVGIYGFTIAPSLTIDTIRLHGTDSSFIRTGHFNAFNPLLVSEADIRALQGSVPLIGTGTGCISATVTLLAPDSCASDTEYYTINIICNAIAPAPYASICPGNTVEAIVSVSDNGNADSIRVTSKFIQNSIADTSVNSCDTSFVIQYSLHNQQAGNSAVTNTKHLQSFSVYLNPEWIDAGSLSVKYFTAGATSQTVGYTDTLGFIKVDLASLGLTIYNDSTGYITFSELKINHGGFSNCTPPNGTLLGKGVISYLSNCGNASYNPPPPYTASSQSSFSNVVGIISQQSVILDSLPNDMVAPGQNPILNYSWQQTPPNGNPWDFRSSVSDSAPFFECPTVIYQAVLNIPEQVVLVNTDSVTYRNGTGNVQSLALVHDTDGLWYATLPGFGNNDTLSYQVKLNLAFCSGDSVSIPPVNISMSLTAICEDGTCSTRYCMKTISNVVSVHCPGICGGTGIGTSQFVITNLNAPGVNAGYACDVIDFKVSGQGFHGSYPTPVPDSTTTIFLVLTYPDSLGATDSIFSLTSATSFATYTHSGVTDTVFISNSAISRTLDSGQWTVIVPITDTAVCRAIRDSDDTFAIDLQMPVECNLGYDSLNYGVCGLGGITALMEFSASGSGVLFSCDNATSSFEVIAHHYGTATSIVPDGACGQTLVIMDSATEGLPTTPEMPGYSRPLINWPTDGSFTVSYPSDMSVQTMIYRDTSGNTDTANIIYSTSALGTEKKTKIYGFQDSLSGYYWPSYSKNGAEFFRELTIQFSQTGCGNQVINDTLPHQLQDGKTAAQCSISCDTFIRFTAHDTSLRSVRAVWLSEATTGDTTLYQEGGDPADVLSFVVPLVVHSIGINPNSIYIAPTIITNPRGAITNPPVITLVGSGMNVPVNNYSGTTIYTPITGDSIQLRIAVNTCTSMQISIPIGYSCSGSDSTGLCYIDSMFSIGFDISHPSIHPLIFTPTTSSFTDCKGICCSDTLKCSILIFNSEAFVGGPAYDPVFLLADSGPGYLNITKVVFTYDNVHQVTVTMPNTTYNNIASFNFSDSVFAGLHLPTDSNGKVYMARNDSIKAEVYVYGDGKNCSSYAQLEAYFDCKNICGAPAPTTYGYTTFTFNITQCDTPVCTGASVCAGFDPWTSCSPCSYGPPIFITGSIINPGCGVNDSTGRISLSVIGGPPNGIGFLPQYTYSWNNGDTTRGIENLLSGTYTVTINDQGCQDTASFTLNNSALIVSPFLTNVSCYNGHNGAISLRVGGGVGNYSYRWSGPNGSMDSTGSGISHLHAGIYAVTITSLDNTTSGCDSTFVDTFIVTSPPAMVIAFSNINANCGIAGSAAVSAVTYGAPLYHYYWSNGDTTQTISHVNAGVYVVTVTDAHPCSTSDTTIVGASNSLTIMANSTNVSCGGGNNGTATLTVTGAAGSFSYAWSNADTTRAISNLYAGIYTVTVTSTGGCIGTDSITITEPVVPLNDAPNVYYPDNCSSIDSGSIYLNTGGGVPPYAWHWSNGSDSENLINPGVGSYFVTVTDANGCIVISSSGILAHTPMQINLISIDPACTGSQGFINIKQSGGLQQSLDIIYTWSNHDTITVTSNGSSFTSSDSIYNLSSGLYIVTVTESGGGTFNTPRWTCSAVDSFSTMPGAHSCCFINPADTIIPLTTDTVWSDTLHIPDSSFVYVNPGTIIIVNSTLTLKQCEIVMGKNSQIIVLATDTLNILGSNLHGCDTMWGGIIQAGGAFITNKFGSKRSRVQDAVAALVNEGGGDDDHIRYTDFYRNQANLGFMLYDAAPALDISACNFGMGGYTNMLPVPRGYTNTNRPEYGIYILFTGDVSIPNPTYSGIADTFENMNQGIVTYGSFINVYNNKFDSIYDYENRGLPNGSAIHAVGNGFGTPAPYGGLLVQTSASTPDTAAIPMFKNCNIAVSVYSQSATVNYNRMENVTYGVYANSCRAAGINVSANYINKTAFGVSLINNGGAMQSVDYNTIHVYPVVEHYGYAGMGWIYVNGDEFYDSTYAHIYAKTYGIEETEVTTSSTVIKHNTIYRGLNCIELNNTYNTEVVDNFMHLANDSAVQGNQAGLYAANCHNLLASRDTVDGDGATYIGAPDTLSTVVTRFRKAGISLYNTFTGNLCSNILAGSTTAKGLGYGMLCAGNCNGAQLFSNTMQATGYGLTLLSSGTGTVVYDQGILGSTYQNNNFPGPFTYTKATYSYIHVNDTITYRRPRFYYYYTQLGTTYVPSNNASYPAAEAIEFLSTPTGSTEFCELIHAIGPQGNNGFTRVVAVDSGQYYMVAGIDSIAANWLAQKTLYESLYADTSVLNNDSIMASFYARIDSSDRGAILISELQNQLLTDSATLADSVGIGGKPSGYVDALTNAHAYTDNIPTTNIQAVNYKAMSNIYLQTLNGIDTFTTGQIDTIKRLAIQCPYLAGDAVYMARSLYSQIDNTVFFNDLNICQPLPDGSYRMLVVSPNNDTTTSAISPTEFVHLYPNPAKNIINLNFYAQTVGNVQFELLDALGQPVIKQILGARTSAQFSTGNLSNGLYYWQLSDSKRTVQIGKVAIMK